MQKCFNKQSIINKMIIIEREFGVDITALRSAFAQSPDKIMWIIDGLDENASRSDMKDFIERKEQTIEDDNDDGNEADEEDEGEKEENDNEKNYQGIMQDENMGDDDEAYGNDEESKNTESRSVNQIVNGKEEDAEVFLMNIDGEMKSKKQVKMDHKCGFLA